MATKYYVVLNGRDTGIFTNWGIAKKLIDGFPNAIFKSFRTRDAAETAFRTGEGMPSNGRNKKPINNRVKQHPAETHGMNYLQMQEYYRQKYPVQIYCDGACSNNPGSSGSGIAVYRNSELSELYFGLYNAYGTNNTAELNALRQALLFAEIEIKKGVCVEILSDSLYSLNCIKKWAPKWKKKGWKKGDGEIMNLTIIKDAYRVYSRYKDSLKLTHVKAHAGIEGNELADRMSLVAIDRQSEDLVSVSVSGEINIKELLRMR